MPATNCNVIDHVLIDADVQMKWLEALADIGRDLRFRDGKCCGVVAIDKDSAFVKGTSTLVIQTSIGGHPVEMDVPAGRWQWSAKVHMPESRAR